MTNIFTDLIPVAYRKYLYALASLALYAYGVWEAVNHDWKQFSISIATALVTTLAHANAGVKPAASVSGNQPAEPPAVG